uniref:Sapep family Mn(2+)-dependent dipeptidase n=1 Tax=uncultured Allobacillus sp. TaxID=1638025 RepID=UPI0025939A54|nr:Sapep family Mn(2+)-dependent dipeptidase [uncultured Allobacillus sp.]
MEQSLFEDYLNQVKQLIQINSVKSSPLKDAPYGEGVKRAFSFVHKLAESFGFHVDNLDQKVLIIDYDSQQSDEYIGIFSHIDVVSVDDVDSWIQPPFSGEIQDERMYGRGTLDNKGPTVAVLYAMKQLKDKGYKPRKGIRLVIGGDEESGMDCLGTYKQKMTAPVFGFTPDAYFPITIKEQGIMPFEVKLPIDEHTCLQEVLVGFSRNVKPQSGNYTLQLEDIERVQDLHAVQKVKVIGERQVKVDVSEESGEAIASVVDHLLTLCGDAEQETKNSLTRIQSLLLDESGEALGIYCEDDDGKLSMRATRLFTTEGGLTVTMDLRYPASFREKDMKEKLADVMAQHQLTYQLDQPKAPINFDANHPMVNKLLAVYERCTGRNEQPKAIAGGTYARIYPDRVIAFGAVYPDEPVTAHQTNENVPLYMMEDWLVIYEEAIRALSQ